MTTPARTITESPNRIDAHDGALRTGYAITDYFGWHITTRNAVRRVDGHTRAARAAVRAVLGGVS